MTGKMFTVFEKRLRYRVLVATRDPHLANIATFEFGADGIDAVITPDLISARQACSNINASELQGIIVDLDLINNPKKNDLNIIKRFGKPVVLISAKPDLKQLTWIYKKHSNLSVVYSLSGTSYSKKKIMKLAKKKLLSGERGIFNVLKTSRDHPPIFSPHTIKKGFVKKHNNLSRLKKNKIKNLINLTLFVLLTLPYALSTYLIFSRVFNVFLIQSKVELNTTFNILATDLKIKRFIYGADVLYAKPWYVGALYKPAKKYAVEEYIKSQIFVEFVSNITYLYNVIVESDTPKKLQFRFPVKESFAGVVFFEVMGLEKDEVDFVNESSLLLAKWIESEDTRKILFLTKSDNNQTFTGGKVKSIRIYEFGNGEVKLSGPYDPESFENRFLGSFTDTEFTGRGDIIDATFNTGDQFEVFKRIFKKTQGITVDAQVSMSDSDAGKLISEFQKNSSGKVTLSSATFFIKKMVDMFTDGKLTFFSGDPKLVTNPVLLSELGDGNEACLKNSIGIINIFDDPSDPSIDISLIGRESGDIIETAIYYSSGSSAQKVALKIPEKQLVDFESGSVLNRFVKTSGDRYLVYDIVPNSKNTKLAEIRLNKDICGSGWGLKIAKQEGRNRIQINYDIALMRDNYFFINGSLTGRGDRLYNSELQHFDKDMVFDFVEFDN